MNFRVMSRRQIEQSNPLLVPHVIISIRNPESPVPRVVQTKKTKGVLYMQFDDLHSPKLATIRAMGYVVLFNEEMADQIIDFVKKHEQEIEYIVCHCEMGVSRSAAVAAALAQFYNGDNREFFGSGIYGSSRYSPNMLVYDILSKKLNLSRQ